ncbi:MAG: hypothetical protein Q8P42_07500 [Gallionella sp.]|nr:hypothetical protein [Gallionella sp.]
MNSCLSIPLNTSAEQAARLQALQNAFAEVCNALVPVVQQTRCWNRVTLHHLTYHDLRARFPQMGSQMVCNAIYSVSRAYRLVLQHPASPWNIARQPAKAIPQVNFLPDSPVYFDRHTLSLKDGKLSMYTLDGRMHFQLELKAEQQAHFQQEKLREIVLAKTVQGYQLSFWFSPPDAQGDVGVAVPESSAELPEHLVVMPGEDAVAGKAQELAA